SLYAWHGDLQGYRQHWSRAADAFEQAIRIEPDKLDYHRSRILLLLADGQIDQARRASSDLLERFAGTADRETAGLVAWYSAIAPGVSGHFEVSVRLAELALAGTPDAEKHDALNTLGAVLYRAGRFDESIRRLHEGAKKRGGDYWVEDWVFLALGHHH